MFWEIAIKVAEPLGERTPENVTYLSEHWLIMGNTNYSKNILLSPADSCTKGKTSPPSPPLHAVKRKKNEETLFLASPVSSASPCSSKRSRVIGGKKWGEMSSEAA